jgi:cephalosporin-C deacetylase-like acetyl esterase
MRVLISLFIATGAAAQTGLPDLTAEAMERLRERAAKIAAIRTPEQVRARQSYVRERVLAQIGGFPEKTPLRPQITGVLQREGYRVEKLIYESQPHFFVTANLYIPERGQPPFPAVVGVAGHSANGKAQVLYQHVWISLAKRGFVVLAFDPPGQGERSEYFDPDLGRSKIGIGTREHSMAGMQCLLAGTTYARYESWDGIRAVDYLLTRKEVDPKRIGVAGNSGGGTQAAYLSVLEPRLAAIVSSCYMTSWEKLWEKPGPQDAEQVFPGFLRDGLDFGDFFLAAAPKPFTMLTAIRDYFPIEGGRATYKEALRIYELIGASEKAGFFEYDDPHGWSKPRREATYRWFEKWLKGNNDEGIEGEVTTEHEADLYATPTGQLATSLGGETVHSLNLKMAERIYPERAAGKIRDAGGLRRLVAGVVGARVLTGSPAGGDKTAVLYIGRKDPDVDALQAAGYVVSIYDPRAGGEPSGGYTGEYQAAQRAMLLGKTLVGMHLAAIQQRIGELSTSGPVALYGKGNGGVLALYAAALDPRIQKVAVDGAVLSYMDVARSKIHNAVEIVIPGVLRSFDLPDLARAIAPRPLWIVEPRTPAGAPVQRTAAMQQYPQARVVGRPEGWPLAKVLAGW